MVATRGARAPRRRPRHRRLAASRKAKTRASGGSKRRSRRCASNSTRSAGTARRADPGPRYAERRIPLLVAGGGTLGGVAVQRRGSCDGRLQPQALKRRAPVIVALHVTDAFAAQDRGLAGGLDTFGDSMESEAFGEPQQMTEEHLVVGAAAEVADKGAVDLDRVDRQRLQMPQRGMPGAEIVERDTATGLAQRADKTGGFFDVVERRGLGDLDDDAARDLGTVAQLRGQGAQPRPVGGGQARA